MNRRLSLVTALWATAPGIAHAGLPDAYAIELVAPAATGIAMNDQGEVVGTRRDDPGCGFACLPPEEIGVWHGPDFMPLPVPAGTTIAPVAINGRGWIVGSSIVGGVGRATLWRPAPGGGYDTVDIGVFPGAVGATATGIDDSDRVIGIASRTFPLPPIAWVWTETGGMVDATTLGFPADTPVAVSPGGVVATHTGWYDLDVPGVSSLLAPLPSGYQAFNAGARINDSGSQLRTLITTSSSSLVYLFRHEPASGWQLLTPLYTSASSINFGLGGITASGDAAATAAANGLVAAGPIGTAEPVAARITSAYPGVQIHRAGAINEAGEILADAFIGRSTRLVRLVPTAPCTTDCLVASHTVFRARFNQDPAHPGQCVSTATTLAQSGVRIVDEHGVPVAGAQVRGRFLDDYWLNEEVVGTTSNQGIVTFNHRGPPCIGAMAFLVTEVSDGSSTWDRTTGRLMRWAIPRQP